MPRAVALGEGGPGVAGTGCFFLKGEGVVITPPSPTSWNNHQPSTELNFLVILFGLVPIFFNIGPNILLACAADNSVNFSRNFLHKSFNN